MGSRRGARRRRTRGRSVLLVLLALAVTSGVVGYGVWDGGREPHAPQAARRPAPHHTPDLGSLDLSALPIPRRPSCAAVDDHNLVAALGSQVTASTAYGDGDRATLAPHVTDVSHEYDCTFDASGAQARIWVFAAPVDTRAADRIAAQTRSRPGCTFPRRAPGYGDPSVTGVCPAAQVGTTATLRGLFGQTWLSCQLTLPPPATDSTTLRHAERWCVHVATTLGAQA